MSATSQLHAHFAVSQIDRVLGDTVGSYLRTLDLLIEEFHEQADARLYIPGYCREEHRSRRGALFARYRAAVVALGDVLVDLRAEVGVDPDDLPPGNAEIESLLGRLRESVKRHRMSTDMQVSK